jgi:nicotinamide mononucleotide transporter
MTETYHQFIKRPRRHGLVNSLPLSNGIASVWFSRIENILVYPIGLISTTIYIFLSVQGHLYGEASVNLYYTLMSIYGWILWTRRNEAHQHVVNIAFSNRREWIQQLSFFAVFYIVIFVSLHFLKLRLVPQAIPWADAFASATAYTGMWLMARKKVESWYWWLATNVASVPLYFVKHYVFTSVYYAILFVMAIFGLLEWIRRARQFKAKTQKV